MLRAGAAAAAHDRRPGLQPAPGVRGIGFRIEVVAGWQESAPLRQAIGKASLGNANGQNAWFKRQSSAERWAGVIAAAFDAAGTPLHLKTDKLRKWVFGA